MLVMLTDIKQYTLALSMNEVDTGTVNNTGVLEVAREDRACR